MLKDIPYTELTKEARAYEIMLLRDQYDNTYNDIAREYNISGARAAQIYRRTLRKKIYLYINHISITLGYSDVLQIRNLYYAVFDCYQNHKYACAYLEKKYDDILTVYRDGEPGIPMQFINSIPPFRPKLNSKTIDCVINMREIQKASFITIAKELQITQAKAKDIYEMFYHKQVLEIIKFLQNKTESKEEKDAIWNFCMRNNKSAKKRYDMLIAAE